MSDSWLYYDLFVFMIYFWFASFASSKVLTLGCENFVAVSHSSRPNV